MVGLRLSTAFNAGSTESSQVSLKLVDVSIPFFPCGRLDRNGGLNQRPSEEVVSFSLSQVQGIVLWLSSSKLLLVL
jgi:hypothetical protein